MQQLLLAVVLSGATCAWLGVHITLRKMSFFGDALAHSTLPGVVVAYAWGFHLLYGALASAVAAVLSISWAARSPKTNHDSAIGVFYTGLFAAGVIGMYQLGQVQDLTHIIVGSPLGVSPSDVQIIAGCAIVVAIGLIFGHRLLSTTMIDEQHAVSIGHNPFLAQLLLLMLTAITVVTAITAVGIVLTVALLVTPAASARLFCKGLIKMILASMGISVACSLLGILLSWHLGWPTGATVVLTLCSTYVVIRALHSLLMRQKVGLVTPKEEAP